MHLNHEVEQYTLEFPFFNSPSPKIKICDKNNNVIGYVNRFYNSIWQTVYTFLFEKSANIYINVQVKDIDNNTLVSLSTTSYWVANRWSGYFYDENNEKCECALKYDSSASKILSDIFLYEYSGIKVKIENKSFGARPYFYDEDNRLIAKCSDEFFDNKLSVDIYDTKKISKHQIIAICYLISLM